MATPRVNLTAVTPRPLPYGLFSVADPVDKNSGEWTNGVAWESVACSLDHGFYGGPCDNPTSKDIDATGHTDVTLDPFTVYVHTECRAIGEYNRARDNAVARLNAVEERGVEAHLWASMIADPDFTDITPTPGTAVPAKVGLALLEQAVPAGALGQPIIHADRTVASLLSDGPVARHGAHLESEIGSLVSAGVGYGPDGPAGAPAAGTRWLLGTVGVLIHRGTMFAPGPQFVQTPLDNTIRTLAERTFVAGYECKPFGVLVTVA